LFVSHLASAEFLGKDRTENFDKGEQAATGTNSTSRSSEQVSLTGKTFASH
jgi:hypothetical protein